MSARSALLKALGLCGSALFMSSISCRLLPEAGAETLRHSPLQFYSVQFPGRSLGRLFVVDKSWNKEAWPAQMLPFSEACGPVRIPQGALIGIRPNALLNENANVLDGKIAKSLTILLANEMEVGDNLLKAISHCSNIERLELNDTDLDDSGLNYLQSLAHLSSVSLKRNAIKGPGLKNLGLCRELLYININNNTLERGCLGGLSKLPCLRQLEACRCKLSDADLVEIGKMEKLERLRLSYNHDITDSGISHLSGMRALRSLDLEDTRITPNGLAKLKLPELQTLVVPSYFPFTKNFAMLAKAFPKASITVPDKMKNNQVELFK